MSLKSPNLDDRRFDDLMEESLQQIKHSCPGWTDLTPSDPGVILLESFAHLTETMIYRLNRVPEKAYIEFLKLLGVTLYPPAASCAVLTFSVKTGADHDVVIPAKTRVSTSRSSSQTDPIVFYTNEKAVIPKGENSVEVKAYNCTPVEGELVGIGTGEAGQSFRLKYSPVVVGGSGEIDFIVGVETDPEKLEERTPAMRYKDKVYRIWNETERFSGTNSDKHLYTVDRIAGIIRFAPEVKKADSSSPEGFFESLAGMVVEHGSEVCVWYSFGGGVSGNVGAGTLTVLKDPVPGVKVTNLRSATGGREQETLNNAILRGPGELHSLERAVTAEDFEHIALKSSGVIRAKAFTKAALWAHARHGTVEILMVPNISEEEISKGQISLDILTSKQSEQILENIRSIIEDRKPLGTECLANWVRYKLVSVKARVAVHKGQEPNEVKTRVEERLYKTISPIPLKDNSGGWKFGKPLRISDIYDIILKEPGVSYSDSVCFHVDDVPGGKISSLTADSFQKNTWFAAEACNLYRSMNNGEGWEAVLKLKDENIKCISASRRSAGYVVIHTKKESDIKSSVYLSRDSGESWEVIADTAFEIESLAWGEREGVPLLFMATDVGLYELWTKKGSVPVQLLVDNNDQDIGFYSVETSFDNRGAQYVVAASQKEKGLFMSGSGGKSGSFKNIGFKGTDVRSISVHVDGPRIFLWAGTTVIGNDEGAGCYFVELTGNDISKSGWDNVKDGWTGGSCRSIAFMGSIVFAGTHRAGVLSLDTSKREHVWQRPGIRCGLPARDTERLFQPVSSLAVNPEQNKLMAGTPEGVFTASGTDQFFKCSEDKFSDKVTLPETWLFCSGRHEIEVELDDES